MSESSTTQTQSTPALRIPGYRIERELGRGGIATVYLAVQELLDREVALKVMSPALAAEPNFTERFIREGRTVAQMCHPNIVSIYEISVADFQHYIAMEYLGGGSLKDLMRQRIPADQALAILGKVAAALGYAHESGFVHRDVKPENIIFRGDDDPVLTDFGIAKSTSSDTQLTNTSVIVGTPRYMSPEQAEGRGADPRADIYALGVILYEMLTGRPPFERKESMALLYSHINDPIPELPGQYVSLQPLVDALMAKRPEDRVADCETLIEMIQTLKRGDSVDDMTRRQHAIARKGRKNKRVGRKAVAVASRRRAVLPAPLLWGGIGVAGTLLVTAAIVALAPRPAPLAPQAASEPTTVAATSEAVPPAVTSGLEESESPAVEPPTEVELVVSQALDLSPADEVGAPAVAEPMQPIPVTPESSTAAAAETERSSPVEETPADAVVGSPVAAEDIQRGSTVEMAKKSASVDRPMADNAPAPKKPPATEAQSPAGTVEVPSAEVAPAAPTVTEEPPSPAAIDTPLSEAQQAQIQDNVANLIMLARKQMDEDRLSYPPGDNALESYRSVLELSPRNSDARDGLARIAKTYLERSLEKIEEKKFENALAYVARGLEAIPGQEDLLEVEAQAKQMLAAQDIYEQAEQLARGIGQVQDEERAAQLYELAAQAGHVEAQFNLGIAYATGRGVPVNEALALKWLREAAIQGNQAAQYNLGLGLVFGAYPDTNAAARWIKRLAEQEYPPAYRFLGWMYNTGTGIDQSLTEAVRWGVKEVSQRRLGKPPVPDRVVDLWQRQFESEIEALEIQPEQPS